MITAAVAVPSVNGAHIIKGRAEVGYSGIVNGEFVNVEELAGIVTTVIAEAMKNARIRVDKIYVGVPHRHTYCTVEQTGLHFEKPHKITRHDMQKMLNSVHHNSDDLLIQKNIVCYYVDGGHPLHDAVGLVCSDLTARVSIVVADSYFTENVREVVAKDFKLEFLPSALAEAMYLIDEDTRDRTCTLISCGMFSTTVSVISGDGLVSTNSFNMGRAHVVNDVSIVLETDYNSASALLDKVILSVKMNEHDNYELITTKRKLNFAAETVNDIIKARLEVIAENITRLIRRTDPNLLTYPIYITGGTTDTILGARDFLEKAIAAPITQCVCPFTKQNKPGQLSLASLINLAIN